MSEGRERRYPPNLQGLFRFCTEHTKTEDASGEHQMEPMSDERRQWLEEALAAMAGNDPIKKMIESIQTLVDGERPLEEREQALEDLQDYCEDIDLANDFHKIGGSSVLARLLDSPTSSDGLRYRAASLVATVTQNNPTGQQTILETGLLPALLSAVDSERESEIVRVKSLYAVSCLVRGNAEAEAALLQADGLSVLLRAMQSGVEKLRLKATYTIGAMCHERPSIKDALVDMGMVEQLVGLMLQHASERVGEGQQEGEHSPFGERLACTLLALVTDDPRAQAECLRPAFKLAALLGERRRALAGREDSEEELGYVNRLAELLHFNLDDAAVDPNNSCAAER